MKKSLVFLLFVMSAITLFGLNTSLARFFFASGSDGLMNLVSSNILVRIVLLSLFLLLVLAFKKYKNQYLYFPILLFTFLFWLWSGRMVALFPDGKIITGWFYLETNRLQLCKNEVDCEKVLYYQTEFKRNYFWNFKIRNNEVETIIFTSPFINEELEKLFSAKFSKNKLK